MGKIVLASLLLATAACTKNSDASRVELLTSGRWRTQYLITVSTKVVNGTTEIDSASSSYDLQDSCRRDDATIFEASGAITLDEGLLKCFQSVPQTQPGGSWAFQRGESRLQISYNGNVTDFQLDELTPGRLRLSSDVSYVLDGDSQNWKTYLAYFK